MSAVVLPAGFEALTPFVDYWARPTTMALLDATPLHAHTPPLAKLAQLVLSLAQAAVAVEMHGQPLSPNTPWPHSVRVPAGAAPYA